MGTLHPIKIRIKIYSPAEIKAMRIFLKESRAQFADRFFLTAETIKGWELGRRNASGPALVILQQIETEINIKKEESRKILEEYRRGCGIKQKSERL
ncbi:hypothetical protein KAR91_60145 [Candidatus Pacearchaeota archaeon]|nr:hypothetical protein [Candidatus Pacearchaeota archaeon]